MVPAHGRWAPAPWDDPPNHFPADSPALGRPYPHLPPFPELQLPSGMFPRGSLAPRPLASPISLPLVPTGSSGPHGPYPHGRPPRHLTSHRASRQPPTLLRHRVSMIQLCFPLPICSITRQICTKFWRHNGEQDTPAPGPFSAPASLPPRRGHPHG